MAVLPDIGLTDTWLDTVYRDSALQTVQSQFTHQQLLDIAFEQTLRRMAPVLIKARPSFFREVSDITLVADTASYDIPSTAMLDVVHLAELIDTQGNIAKLSRREPPEDIFFYQSGSSHPQWVRLQDKTIQVDPPPSSGDVTTWTTLRTYIHRRPNRYVRATTDSSGDNPGRCARVVSVASGVVTFDAALPSDFSASSSHDFFSATTHKRIATAVDASAIDTVGLTQTFPTASAALLTAGDWVCLNGETCFLPFPVEFAGHLKDLTIKSMAKTQADQKAYEAAVKEMADDITTTYVAAADPMPGNPQIATLHQSPFLAAMRRGRNLVRT